MKVAIVGSGIAGLSASHFLSKRGHQVHLYEALPQIGMAAQTIDIAADNLDAADNLVAADNGVATVRGDVPSRMFNDRLWPTVARLYRSLGLDTIDVDATQSYRISGHRHPSLMLEMPFRWRSELSPARIAQHTTAAISALASGQTRSKNRPTGSNGSNGSHQALQIDDQDNRTGVGEENAIEGNLSKRRSEFLLEIRRLREQGSADLPTLDRQMPFVDYLDRHDFPRVFRESFLYPALSSTVCTCSHAAIKNYPAVVLLDAMQHISSDRRLQRVVGGTPAVARRLSQGVEKIFLKTPVASIAQSGDGVTLTVSQERRHYDRVVIASQANRVARVFPDLPDSEKAILNGFEYEDVEVIVHTDPQFMPPDRKDWATFNFSAQGNGSGSMCTVWMNRFHHDWHRHGAPRDVFQTIRPIHDVQHGQLLQRAQLQRPIVDANSWDRWERLRSLLRQPLRRIWYCGAYAMPGIPLLESAVGSAYEVAEAISASID